MRIHSVRYTDIFRDIDRRFRRDIDVPVQRIADGIEHEAIEFALATESRLVLGGSYAYSDMRIPPRENPFTGELTRLASIFAPR